VNIPIALYFNLIHQRAPIDVMNFVYKSIPPFAQIASSVDEHRLHALMLMPCHSTPFYSFFVGSLDL
jgi:hypothetical protein